MLLISAMPSRSQQLSRPDIGTVCDLEARSSWQHIIGGSRYPGCQDVGVTSEVHAYPTEAILDHRVSDWISTFEQSHLLCQ